MTLPLVILGSLGKADMRFSSRIHEETSFVDSTPCSGVSKSTERAEDAVAGLDQVVAGEARELAQLGEEGLVDLGGQLDRTIL